METKQSNVFAESLYFRWQIKKKSDENQPRITVRLAFIIRL